MKIKVEIKASEASQAGADSAISKMLLARQKAFAAKQEANKPLITSERPEAPALSAQAQRKAKIPEIKTAKVQVKEIEGGFFAGFEGVESSR